MLIQASKFCTKIRILKQYTKIHDTRRAYTPTLKMIYTYTLKYFGQTLQADPRRSTIGQLFSIRAHIKAFEAEQMLFPDLKITKHCRYKITTPENLWRKHIPRIPSHIACRT